MEALIARQPIFTADLTVYGYELLFRSARDGVSRLGDPDRATATVISNASSLFGIDTVTRGKKAFVNVTRDTLLGSYIRVLPPRRTVVELAETLSFDAGVVEACRALKEEGYSIALDGYACQEDHESLLELADIVKVDLLATPEDDWRRLVARSARGSLRLLAKKVETREAYEAARAAGFSLFQGFFFCKPVTLSTKDIPLSKLGQLLILQEVNKPELDFDEIEGIIKREVSLAYKFLKYINSARFAWRAPIGGVRHGLTLVGQRETKKWASVAAVACMADGQPEELVVQAVVRAKFCEGLGKAVGLRNRAEELFLMGLFSMLEPILEQRLSSVMEQLPVADDVKAALAGEPNRLRDVYDCVLACERGEWLELGHLTESDASTVYVNAVEWVDQGFHGRLPVVTPASLR